MYRKIELVLLILLLAGLVAVSRHLEKQASSSKVDTKENMIVIDCGHGGDDPGKVGINDALEKDINLQIGKRVKKKLEKKGYEVVMTREKDETLAEESSSNKKVQDMKARVALINETAPAVAVSIHQNSYQEESVHGAQVFYYSHSAEGEEAAKIMQEAFLLADPENTRQAKANDTYYLLKRTKIPTIIVECGFLSNRNEAELLAGEAYQKKVSDAIVSGIEEYLSSKRLESK